MRRITRFAADINGQRRTLKHPFNVVVGNGALTVANAKERAASCHIKGKIPTNRYQVEMLSIAIGLLQAGEYMAARSKALAAHEWVVSHRGATSELAYFTSVTAAECCERLAQQIEAKQFDERPLVPTEALTPSASKVLNSTRYIAKFRKEAAQLRALATRIRSMPSRFYMRSANERAHEQRTWEDTSSSTHHNQDSFYEGSGSSAYDSGPNSGGEEAAHSTRFGKGWKERRKRTYHDEVRRHLRNANGNIPR
jgi:hypothetical protein